LGWLLNKEKPNGRPLMFHSTEISCGGGGKKQIY